MRILNGFKLARARELHDSAIANAVFHFRLPMQKHLNKFLLDDFYAKGNTPISLSLKC